MGTRSITNFLFTHMLDKLKWANEAANSSSNMDSESRDSLSDINLWKSRVGQSEFSYAPSPNPSNDGKYNPNRPRDVIRKISSDSYRAPSVISGHSKASEQSRASNISRKSHISNGSMTQMIKDSKKDFRDSIYESCITGGPLGPARTKEEIRNRKTLL